MEPPFHLCFLTLSSRGTKGTLFEGGTRAVTFLHGPHILQKSGYVSNSLVHITDWMPTLLR